jgi:hypothetical protein
VTRFVIDDSSVCLINCHLAAGQHHVRQRNSDVAAMVEDKALFPAASVFEEPVAYVGGGDGSMVLDHEIVFVSCNILPTGSGVVDWRNEGRWRYELSN